MIRRIHYAAHERVCPVRAVLAWAAFLTARGITTGPLFTRIDRWGNVGPAAGGRYADPPASSGTAPGRPQPKAAATGAFARRPSALSSPRGARPRASPRPPRRRARRTRRANARTLIVAGKSAATAATASAVAGPRPCSRPARSRCTSAATAAGPTVHDRSPATSRRPPASATPIRPRACCYARQFRGQTCPVPAPREADSPLAGRAPAGVTRICAICNRAGRWLPRWTLLRQAAES